MKKLRVVTNSEICCHRTCARKHYYRYELLLRPPGAEDYALSDGKQGHDYQEDWWSGKSDVRYPADIQMRALMVGYDARWGDDHSWVNVSVEQEFYIPYAVHGNVQIILGAKVDGIVRSTDDQQLYVREFKTTAYDVAPGSFYWQSIRLNTQIDTYSLVLNSLGAEVNGTLYDVAHKPRFEPHKALPPDKVKWTKPKPATKTKPAEPARPYANQRIEDETDAEFESRVANYIGERPEQFYARSVIRRTEDQIEEFEDELGAYVHRMMTSPPYRNQDSCIKFNRLCEYHPLCAGYGKPEDYKKAERRHTELERVDEVEESGKV
jgi:hypothetical protein